MTLNSAFLVSLAAVILSGLASYVPKFNVWYALKTKQEKQLIMAGALLVASIGVMIAACVPVLAAHLPFALACTSQSVADLFFLWLTAVISNQSIFSISPEAKAVTEAKSLAKSYSI